MAEDDAPRRPDQTDDSGHWQGRERRVNPASNAGKSETFQNYREIERRQYPGDRREVQDEAVRDLFLEINVRIGNPESQNRFIAIWKEAEKRYDRREWWGGLRQPVMIIVLSTIAALVFGQSALSWLWSHVAEHLK